MVMILNSWSSSEVPGNSGLSMYSSAIIQPNAQMSIGELYEVERSRISGARYLQNNNHHKIESLFLGIYSFWQNDSGNDKRNLMDLPMSPKLILFS